MYVYTVSIFRRRCASVIDWVHWSSAYQVAFWYSLRVLKIYGIRNAHCRYWILAV